MRLSLGIFDVYTHAIPGSLYLALGVYVAGRLDLLHTGQLSHVPAVLLIGGIVVAAYLLGQLTYFIGSLIDMLPAFRRQSPEHIRRHFLQRVPHAAERPYIDADGFLLLAAIERYDKDAAQEISRLRATGLMVRNCCFPLLLACVVATTEAVTGAHAGLATACAAFLGIGGLIALPSARQLRNWAVLKTYETCFWLPEIDAALRPPRRRHFLRR